MSKLQARTRRSDLFNLIIAHAVLASDFNLFLYNLGYQIRSIYLFEKLGLGLSTLQMTPLESNLVSNYGKKMVKEVLRELNEKFPYVKKD